MTHSYTLGSRSEADGRGQVGIGTLIVFIALVLVAAIAAGVLINTAGFLQAQSEQTGQESTSQVTDRLQTVSVTGANVTDGTIYRINVTVSKAPGADDIDLLNVTAQWSGPQGAYVLNEEIQDGDPSFQAVAFKDADGSFSADSQVINDADDRAILIFEPGVKFGDEGLHEGETAEIRLTTGSASTTVVRISAPRSLAGKSSVAL